MSELSGVQEAFGDKPLQNDLLTQIGSATKRLEDIANDMAKAKDEDTARYQTLKEEQTAQAATLSELKAKHEADTRESEVKAALDFAASMKAELANIRTPSMASVISGGATAKASTEGAFINAVAKAGSKDAELQAEGKAALREQGFTYEGSWGKATLGSTDATGGWIVPNALVDEFIKPAGHRNIYRELMTVVPGVRSAVVDQPFRIAAASAAVIAAFGDTKENSNLVYNGYSVTMYTLARIYDVSNQFLRQSQGAAERDVMSELANAFALGEAKYIREGTGSSQPMGYTTALTAGPATFRSTLSSPSDSTLAGSIASGIAIAAGDLSTRGVTPTAAVLAGAAYWQMLRQGSDTAGFWFATQERSPASIRPGTLISPFGLPVFADTAASNTATAAVIDDLVVADWKAFKVFFGESYRVDQSDEAGERWDKNLTGFRGEEEMGFDARAAVYAGYAQQINDVIP